MNALLRWTLMLVVVLGAIGCRGKRSNITGTITRDGKPLVWKTDGGHLLVIFFPENRRANQEVYSADTNRETGTYRIAELPAGRYRVAIQQFDERHNDALEHRYNPAITPLRCEVLHDGQEIDFDLPEELPGRDHP